MRIIHNYDAVNAAIDQEHRKAQEALSYERASRWELYGGTAIKFSCAAAILVLALGLAWWLFGDQVAGGSITTITSRVDEIVKNAPAKTATGATIKTEFTVFHTAAQANGSEVVTGWQYKPENLEEPYYKYCYHSTRTLGLSSKQYNLAYADASGAVEWHNVDAEYKKYFDECQFY